MARRKDKRGPSVSELTRLESAARSQRRRRCALLGACVVVSVLALAGIAFGLRWHSAPPASTRTRLNVLLVTLDTTRADHVGCYGGRAARTPTLDRLASEGVRFEQALSPAPITFAAHCSIFTGLYPFEHGARGNGEFYLDRRFPTIATALHGAGYRTAAFVSAFVLDRRYGLSAGFDIYDDRMDAAADTHVVDIEAERRGDRTVAALSAWLDTYARDRSAPFLVWLHLYDPHTPYTPPSPLREAFVDSPYDGEIAFDDSLLASLLDRLGRLRLLDDTLVVVVGDHGESLGDHGEETHSMFVYESAIRVPFIAWRPGLVPSGVVVRQPVRLTDVAASILDLAGVRGLATPNGRSLIPEMRGRATAPAPVYSETLAPQLNMNWAPLRSVRDERWKLIEAPRTEIYDLQMDPGETHNLASEQPQKVRALTDLLARVAGNGQGAISRTPIDAATRNRLAALGYIGAGSGAGTPSDLSRAPDPKDLISLYNRLNGASRAAREGRFADALPILNDVLARDPRNVFAQLTLGDVYLGSGQYAKAIERYRAYLNMVPPTAYVHHLVAICSLRLGRAREALQEASAALAIDPRFVDAHILRGSVLDQRGEHEAAIAEFRAAAESDPGKPMIRLDLAKALVEAGRHEEAQREYETVLRQEPDFPPAMADLGALYMKDGRWQEAESVLLRALARDPEQQEARFNLATIYERASRTQEAAAEYRRLLASKTTADGLRRAASDRLRNLGPR